MSDIATKLTYLNTTKGKIKDSINLTGAGITTEPFRQYAVKLKDAYVDIINNGTDTLYNNFPKVSGSGTDLSLQNTYEAPMQSTLKGNTSQVQLSGKNLFNDYNTTSSTDRGVSYSYTNDEILINGIYDQTGNWNCWLTASNNGNASNNMALLKANTTYTISIYIVSGTTTNTNNQLYISSRDSNKANFVWNYKLATYDSSTQRYKVSFTTTDSVYISGIRYSISPSNTAVFNNLKLKIQIEEGNTSTDFEQYCGGIPSPNPSYPQDIHNVSGNNTITISDGESDTTTYPINLPNGMELCKIGTYQDYFYKDSDKWYLHKKTGKVVLDGSETGWNRTASGMAYSFFKPRPTDSLAPLYTYYCNYFKSTIGYGSTNNSTYIGNTNIIFSNVLVNGEYILTTDNFKTWLSTHNTIVYYVLATPTNTEITDTTLLSQLEAIYNAKSKNGTTNISQVNNDLPFIITASALEKE